jgi:DNA replication protein DnaC
MQRYLKPKLFIVDELGYLPIDKLGADLLFQIISERYERGAILMSTNRAFKTGRKSSTTTPRSPPRCSTGSSITPTFRAESVRH